MTVVLLMAINPRRAERVYALSAKAYAKGDGHAVDNFLMCLNSLRLDRGEGKGNGLVLTCLEEAVTVIDRGIRIPTIPDREKLRELCLFWGKIVHELGIPPRFDVPSFFERLDLQAPLSRKISCLVAICMVDPHNSIDRNLLAARIHHKLLELSCRCSYDESLVTMDELFHTLGKLITLKQKIPSLEYGYWPLISQAVYAYADLHAAAKPASS